jgi:hypothetical protein
MAKGMKILPNGDVEFTTKSGVVLITDEGVILPDGSVLEPTDALPALTAAATDDLLPIHDVSADAAKKITVEQLKGYKSYVALLSQSGTAAPVATVLENTLGGTVVWTRGGVGDYVGTLVGAFPVSKTCCIVSPSYEDPTAGVVTLSLKRGSDDYVRLQIALNSEPLELSDLGPQTLLSVEIRVYP